MSDQPSKAASPIICYGLAIYLRARRQAGAGQDVLTNLNFRNEILQIWDVSISLEVFAFHSGHAGTAYSITSSALATIDGGMARPSALAVLRLMTNSNVVGCMTGRSVGLAPLRILPV